MEEIAIRLLRDDDIPQISDLYKKAYQVDRSTEKFKWEFQNGPAGPAIYVVAVDTKQNRVVGTQCAIPLYVVNTSGERILTAKSEDTLVDANYRGKNIFERMYDLLFAECRKAGIVAIWGFTFAIKPFRKLGFDIPFHCDFGLIAFSAAGAYRYFDELKDKRTLTEKGKIAGLAVVSRLKYMFHFGEKANGIITKVQEHLEDQKLSDVESFSLLHDPKFLNWRLRTNPYPNNHLYYSLNGQAVICSHTEEVSYIMYLSPSIKEAFLNAVIADLSKRTNVLRFWGFTHNAAGRREIEILKRAGFFFTGQGISFVWKVLDEKKSLDVTNFVLSRLAAQGT